MIYARMFRLMTLSILICFLLSGYQIRKEIDIETVRKDVLMSGKEWVPLRQISKMKTSMFDPFYVNDYCLVHLPYKDYLGESFMKSSVVAIYVYHNNSWKYQGVVPYYYKMSLIDGSKFYFLSSNLFCEPNGDCNSFYEISKFENSDFAEVKAYSGFDRYNYYSGLISLDRTREVRDVIGDTIRHQIVLKDFKFLKQELSSFVVEEEFAKLVGISDTLIIQSTRQTRKINL